MNRNLSQTAKLLGVESAQVKNWSSLFKDCLSRGANPAKGQPRSFRDSDLFVLNYIRSRWNTEPDIEAIKTDLSWDENRDDQFQEKLYWHTPLLQEPPDDLDETWRHGVLLCGGGRYEYLELARNYKYVADSMLQSALEKDELSHWAYPILFAYRHTLELYLKIIGEIEEPTHSLKDCVKLAEKRHGGKKIKSPIREWMLELDKIDPGGTAFRYADGEHTSNPYAEYWFDFQHFKFAMKQVFDEIDMAILRLGVTGRPARKKSIESDPAIVIDVAKERIENCCKTILTERGEPMSGIPDVATLIENTLKELRFLPEGVTKSARCTELIKQLLSNLGTICIGLAELRGLNTSGHGKLGHTSGLSPRHAKLALGAATTLTTFLFETHKETKS